MRAFRLSSSSVSGRVPLVMIWPILAAGLGWSAILSWKSPASGADETAKERPELVAPVRFYCPMHPSYHASRPGDCPLCNMEMTPLEGGAAPEIPLIEGHATVHLAASRLQLIGVRTERVEPRGCARKLRLPARVEVNAEGLTDVSLKTTGWVDELFVRWEGAVVEPGEPLFTLYSPEMYETQRKYILAQTLLVKNLAAGQAEAEASRRQQIEATRARLALWDLTDAQIQALDQTDAEPASTTTILAREGGVVLRCNVVKGARVEPGESLYQLADLSSVWVMAEIYEADLPRVALGAPATVELDSRPGEVLAAEVDYLYPTLDERTRTGRARLVVDNSSGEFRPGMYATVTIAIDLGEQLAIDGEAVLDSGLRTLVFVELAPGEFEPREVELGERFDGRVLVRSGLEEGERVVTSGTFLIDSESRLQAALASFASEAGPEAAAATR